MGPKVARGGGGGWGSLLWPFPYHPILPGQAGLGMIA